MFQITIILFVTSNHQITSFVFPNFSTAQTEKKSWEIVNLLFYFFILFHILHFYFYLFTFLLFSYFFTFLSYFTIIFCFLFYYLCMNLMKNGIVFSLFHNRFMLKWKTGPFEKNLKITISSIFQKYQQIKGK